MTDETFIGNVNPFRYRGYYYDTDSGLYYLQSRYYDPEVGRFINADDIDYIEPETLMGCNLYAYCGNNPVMYVDPSGCFWDYVLDAIFLIWGLVDLINGGYKKWENWLSFGIDLVFAVLPFVPAGAGQVIKVGNRIDDAYDVAKAINRMGDFRNIEKVTMIGRNMNRVKNTASLLGKADNLYDVWKGYKKAKGIRGIFYNGISMFHDGAWMFQKLRHGYTVIDIGLTTGHKFLGAWYGIERFVTGLWETRNIWKLVVNYYF